MPKNKGRGGKNRKRGTCKNINPKGELLYRNEAEQYAKVIKLFGQGRVEAKCLADGKTRICKICGKMKKKIWIAVGDLVLVSMRDFQDDKGDIIHKYTPEDAKTLRKLKEIPEDEEEGKTNDDIFTDSEGEEEPTKKEEDESEDEDEDDEDESGDEDEDDDEEDDEDDDEDESSESGSNLSESEGEEDSDEESEEEKQSSNKKQAPVTNKKQVPVMKKKVESSSEEESD